jgi:hypothetical protein
MMLNEEFNDYRGLHLVKIFLTGPPSSGKIFYAERLSVYYNIPRVHTKARFSLGLLKEALGT